jgi:hypothetical protein
MSDEIVYGRHGTEYVLVPVDPITELGAPADPTNLVCKMTFASGLELPDTPTWYDATWQVDTTTDPDTYYVRGRIGPDTSGTAGPGQLAVGLWWPHVQILDGPNETVVRPADAPIRIT